VAAIKTNELQAAHDGETGSAKEVKLQAVHDGEVGCSQKREMDPDKMINSKSETCGGCRHQMSLHWINKTSPTEHSTDDVAVTERATGAAAGGGACGLLTQ